MVGFGVSAPSTDRLDLAQAQSPTLLFDAENPSGELGFCQFFVGTRTLLPSALTVTNKYQTAHIFHLW